jgi:hypothetical protein
MRGGRYLSSGIPRWFGDNVKGWSVGFAVSF